MRTLLRRVRRHSRAVPWRSIPRPVRLASVAVVTTFAVIIALTAAGVFGRPGGDRRELPAGIDMFPGQGGLRVSASPSPATATKASYSGIILPDLLIVMPSGLTGPQIAGLRQIKGVRKMITFDGAEISVSGRQASVIGVNPDQFRSWVPLASATDQKLWTDLAAGDFIASSQATASLRLTAGHSYQLTGRASLPVTFAAAANLGIDGVDVLVNQALSAKLGLVHRVAALISAPGPSVATLRAQVRVVLGAGARVVDLRGGRLPVTTVRPAQITSYLQLFQDSAQKYCPGLSWTVLAAIGQIESADGQDMGPSSAGALGPMQFLPSTWAEWGIDGFGPAGPPNIMNPLDAVPAAARMLCADGAGTSAGLSQAIFDYNHAQWYVNEVLALASQYAAEYR
jgi:Transglycosylase SLT domain